MKCVYCNADQNITDSDIIPYALTGAKLHKRFVCEHHNKFTNDKYEKNWINSLAIFRNLLGFTTRDGNSISFDATVSIGEKDIKVKFSNLSTLLENKKSVYRVKGNDNTLFGNVDKISKIAEARGGEISEVDLSSIIISTTLSSASFTSSSVLHAIAKIAYESHCYFNNVNEYIERKYGNIVNYILSPSDTQNIVEIVTSEKMYQIFDSLSIFGTNAVLEYDDDDGYRYVIFGLWNVIYYKVKICLSNLLGVREKYSKVYLFYPDGETGEAIMILEHIASKNAVDALNEIYLQISNRLECLYQPYFSYKSLLLQKKRFEERLVNLENGKITINQFIDIGNIATISYIYMFEFLLENKERFRNEISFLDNLYMLVGSDKLELSNDMLNNLAIRYSEMYESGTFIQMMKQALHFFDTLSK